MSFITPFTETVRSNFKHAGIKDVTFLLCLNLSIVLFTATSFENAVYWFADYPKSLVFFVLSQAGITALWFVLLILTPQQSHSLLYVRLTLSPIFILLFIVPYNYFFPQPGGVHPLVALGIVTVAGVIIHQKLTRNPPAPPIRSNTKHLPSELILFIVLYSFFFGFISISRHLHFQNINSFDLGLYNQIQWNNIHGRFFQSSISGSNFVTHNSPFLILLSPFYAIFPHPATLLVMKTLFIAFSAIPFYMIMREWLDSSATLPLTAAYLFYPFIVGQNFNAPHEMCFITPFLLISFYFFLKQRFGPFMAFLLLSISVKEHMAFLALMYGLYAFFLKCSKRWILFPLGFGAAWAALSLLIIHSFQMRYTTDPAPAWLIENITTRFFPIGPDQIPHILSGIRTSNLGHFPNFLFPYLLFSPAGLILPLLSPIVLLGAPELAINLLASLTIIYPEWHYNIVVACFLMVASAAGIQKLSAFLKKRAPDLKRSTIEGVFAWLLLACAAVHSFLWLDYLFIRPDAAYRAAVNQALRMIPKDATVSTSKDLAAYVSSRKDYFLLNDPQRGDFILLNQGKTLQETFKDGKTVGDYHLIFEKDSVDLYKKIKGRPDDRSQDGLL